MMTSTGSDLNVFLEGSESERAWSGRDWQVSHTLPHLSKYGESIRMQKYFLLSQTHLYCSAARVKTQMYSGSPMRRRNLKFRSEIEFKGARAGQGPGAPGPNDRYSGSGVRSCFSTLHCTIAQAASPNHQTSPIL